MTGALRVLMLGPGLEVQGGISTVERMLLAALPPRIAATHVATMVEGSKARKLSVFLKAVFSTLKMQRAHLAHIHFASNASSVRKMSLARVARARGCKVILHAHGGLYPDYWRAMSAPARAATAGVLREADALIVLGERWREFFVSVGVDAGRITVLPNPVALPAALPARVPNGRTTIAHLGLIAEAKGSFDLVEALARLSPDTQRRVRLVVAGNGARAALERRVAALGLGACVEVRDWMPPAERDALLAKTDVLALPSYHEGLPMVVLEAMAWGVTPLCTPVGAIPEVVRHEGNGLLVPPGDIDALARGVETLVSQPEFRSRLGRAARAQVEPLAIERYAPRLVDLYDRVAGLN